eukprot:sb/3469698/
MCFIYCIKFAVSPASMSKKSSTQNLFDVKDTSELSNHVICDVTQRADTMAQNGGTHSDDPTEEEFMDVPEELPRTQADIEKEADDARNEGNTAYKQRNYYAAIKSYTTAINLLPENAPYYGNRSAAYMMVNNYTSALSDATRSVELEPTYFKGLLRQIKCYIALGNLTAASRALEDLKSRDTENSTSYGTETTNINRLRELESNADKDMVKNDYRKVMSICFG